MDIGVDGDGADLIVEFGLRTETDFDGLSLTGQHGCHGQIRKAHVEVRLFVVLFFGLFLIGGFAGGRIDGCGEDGIEFDRQKEELVFLCTLLRKGNQVLAE